MKVLKPKICTNAFKIIDNAIYQRIKNKVKYLFSKRLKKIKQTELFFLLSRQDPQKSYTSILITRPIKVSNVRMYHDDKLYKLSKSTINKINV